MTDEIPSLPPRAEALLASLRSLRDKIENVLDDRDSPLFSGESPDGIVEMAEEVPYRLGSLQDDLEQIVRQLESLDQAMSGETAREADVYRAFGRFEAVVDDLLTAWREMQIWERDGLVDDETALFYLGNIYEYVLGEIHDWLKRFVFALEHPVNDTVIFTDRLEFDGTPDMTLLQAWMENSRPPDRRSRNSLFMFVLGVAVGGWLFGGDDK